MGTFFAYARVSTPRQGEKGVSLTEQRDAIERYARVHGLQIARWFEERESASHQGRPAFNEMLRCLLKESVQGVIIHKIDRSARNLGDWNNIVRLVENGVKVFFATENVDMDTVSGRLSADIQAVVAAHYSRNLREEVKKGLYGRLKQGFYPLRAPVGYLDQGSAKPKIPDPLRAPLIRECFELYGSAKYSLHPLIVEMFRRGLRNHNGGRVTLNGMATILRNPFYVGLMRIKKTGETFTGNHEPLVSTQLFEEVQALLDGKRTDRISRHVFCFSRIARCASCGYSLIAERKKGHVYYRCHNRPFKNPAVCPPTSVREEQIERAVLISLSEIDLSEDEAARAYECLGAKRKELTQQKMAITQSLQLQLDHATSRLGKLTDLLIEGAVDKGLFTEKQNAFLLEQVQIREKLRAAQEGSQRALESVEKTVELAKSPSTLYKTASAKNKRELVKTLLSNLVVSGKNVDVTLALPFRLIADRNKTPDCGPYRGTCRTWEEIINSLHRHSEDTSSLCQN